MKYFSMIALAGLVPTLTTAEDVSRKTFLMVQLAENATLDGDTLSLSNASDNVIIFTDRPCHDTAMHPLTDLITVWNKGEDSFRADLPNAPLTGMAGNEEVGLIVELSAPQLDGNTLTFHYTLLQGTKQDVLTSVSLFIDSGEWPWEWSVTGAECVGTIGLLNKCG